MNSKSERLAKLLIRLLPDEGTYQLMALSTAESNLQRKKEAALDVLRGMDETPNREQLLDWWSKLREMLHAYLRLSDTIEETCALLGPIADENLGGGGRALALKGSADDGSIKEKLRSGELFWVEGTDDIN